MIGRRQVLQVQQQPARSRVAVTRLPDAARVEQPLAIGEVELGAVALRLAGCELTLAAYERERRIRRLTEGPPEFSEQRIDLPRTRK